MQLTNAAYRKRHYFSRVDMTTLQFANIARLVTDDQFAIASFGQTQDDWRVTVSDQIVRIVTAMTKHGYTPLKHVAHTAHGLYMVSTYTPNLERFYNITKSMPVLPMYAIAEQLARCEGKWQHREVA